MKLHVNNLIESESHYAKRLSLSYSTVTLRRIQHNAYTRQLCVHAEQERVPYTLHTLHARNNRHVDSDQSDLMLESLRSVVVSDDDSVTVTMNNDANTTLIFPNIDEVHEFIHQLSDAVDDERNAYTATQLRDR